MLSTAILILAFAMLLVSLAMRIGAKEPIQHRAPPARDDVRVFNNVKQLALWLDVNRRRN